MEAVSIHLKANNISEYNSSLKVVDPFETPWRVQLRNGSSSRRLDNACRLNLSGLRHDRMEKTPTRQRDCSLLT